MKRAIKSKLIPVYELLAAQYLGGNIKLNPHKRHAVMFLSPDYGNVGDLAIERAQRKFLNKILPDYEVVSIVVGDTYKYVKSIRKQLNKNDLIFIIGGGSFGDLYPRADFGRNFIIKYFKDYKIISFPQTIVYTNTNHGENRKAITAKLLPTHSSVIIGAREKITYSWVQDNFRNVKSYISPDIVFSLLDSFKALPAVERTQITLTLRSDGEKFIPQEDQNKLISHIHDIDSRVNILDTEVEDFNINQKDAYINSVIEQYRKSKLVITDRLHGMIFATITGTPCIVLPNSNHKIAETYRNWLQDCNYISLFEKVDLKLIDSEIQRYSSVDFKSNYDSINFDFSTLEKIILSSAG